ncbi:Fc.00g075470.m01.CDS01 [Cosmosporella sp. VM-42]
MATSSHSEEGRNQDAPLPGIHADQTTGWLSATDQRVLSIGETVIINNLDLIEAPRTSLRSATRSAWESGPSVINHLTDSTDEKKDGPGEEEFKNTDAYWLDRRFAPLVTCDKYASYPLDFIEKARNVIFDKLEWREAGEVSEALTGLSYFHASELCILLSRDYVLAQAKTPEW